ncbi:hypothetical protein K523DRAFT_122354 [Schizophyllum commune Tattone D]|nr:hypothetical protein K523DRAFT_122354 [Schizophyllum commune Tattone D]
MCRALHPRPVQRNYKRCLLLQGCRPELHPRCLLQPDRIPAGNRGVWQLLSCLRPVETPRLSMLVQGNCGKGPGQACSGHGCGDFRNIM